MLGFLDPGPSEVQVLLDHSFESGLPVRDLVLQKLGPARKISQRTAQNYEAAVRTLSGGTNTDSPRFTDLVDIFFLKATSLAASTNRLNRAALIHEVRLKCHLFSNADWIAAKCVVEWKCDSAEKGVKTKSVPEDHCTQILDYLLKPPYNVTRWVTAYWIMMILAGGGRPNESATASWDDERQVLRVPNSKQKHDLPAYFKSSAFSDAHGLTIRPVISETKIPMSYRQVPIDEIDRPSVLHFLALRDDFFLTMQEVDPNVTLEEAWTRLYDSCRKALQRACTAVFGRPLYSLYSFRKQFSANVRARFGSDTGRVLMGHADQRSGQFYGKSRAAHSRFKESIRQDSKHAQLQSPQTLPMFHE